MGIEMKSYYRPLSLESFQYLLKKADRKAVILAGGDYKAEPPEKGGVMIDLQALKLDLMHREGEIQFVGGMVPLVRLPLACPELPVIRDALQHESGANLINALSLANFLRHAKGRSPLLISLLALAPALFLLTGEKMGLEEFLVKREELQFPFTQELSFRVANLLSYAQVARSPLDQPIIALALSKLELGDYRCVLGGTDAIPCVISGNSKLIREALEARLLQMEDAWASAAYRRDAGLALFNRTLSTMEAKEAK